MKTEAGKNRGGTNEMKKIMFMAAAAIAVLAGCSKEMETVSPGSITFEKGQTVTLNVIAGTTETRVSSQLDITSGNVNFRWQEGDSIKVKVGVDSAVFTITSFSVDSTVGTFTGRMPAGDSIFSVQYPYTEPDLATQTYSSTEQIPHDMMKFAADSCSLASPSFTLKPKYAALRLNLYGTSQTISKIVVTNTTSFETPKPSYTLNISPAVTLPAAKADSMAFFIVVPAGSYNFSAEVTSADTGSSLATPPTDAIQNGVFTVSGPTFTTSLIKTFTAGRVLNMDAKEVCFTKVYFSKGNLYYDGSFKFEQNQYSYHSSTSTPTGLFRWANNSGNLSNDVSSAIDTTSSLSGSKSDIFFTNATQTTPRADFTVAGLTGVWRTLSGGNSGEWYYLLNNRKVTVGGESKTSYGKGSVNGVNGLIILPDNWDGSLCTGFTYGNSKWSNEFTESTTPKWSAMESAGCVFLPVAGSRSGSGLLFVDFNCLYWSSTPSSSSLTYAYYLFLNRNNDVKPTEVSPRYSGLSVRLVCAAQ